MFRWKPWLLAAALAATAAHCALDGCIPCSPDPSLEQQCQQGCLDARDLCLATGTPINEGAICRSGGTCDGGVCDVRDAGP